MKKRIIVSLILGVMICCIAAYSFGTTGIVNTESLRLRKLNSTESDILSVLSVNEKLEIISHTEDGWYQVNYKDAKGNTISGFVSDDYVDVKEETVPTKKEENENSVEANEEPTETVDPSGNTENGTKENTTKIINKGQIVYAIPLINSTCIRELEKDLTVEVKAKLNGWMYVTSDDFEGWVREEWLKEEKQNDIPITNDKPTVSEKKIGYISATAVNFREGPNTSAKIISSLSRNTEVEILDETNGWKKISCNGSTGYVLGDYISSTKTETTSRNLDERRVANAPVTTNEPVETHEPVIQTEPEEQNTTVEKTDEIIETKTTDTASDLVAYAKQFLGNKYVYGGTTPAGFDCSGFTQYVYAHFGYSINRTSSSQASNGVGVSKSNLQAGDIICFSGASGSTSISHVGIYIGGGKFIHAANSRRGVIISNVDGDGFFYVCARRIIN